jgi:hypothetical protein
MNGPFKPSGGDQPEVVIAFTFPRRFVLCVVAAVFLNAVATVLISAAFVLHVVTR